MSGVVGDLSPSQESALATLRTLFAEEIKARPLYFSDPYLLRFLRNRQFDVEKTEAKLRATLEFKEKHGAFTILEDYTPPPVCVQFYPTGCLPELDNDGRVLSLLCLGNMDVKGLLKSCSREEIIKYKVFLMERLEKKIRDAAAKTGKPHDSVVSFLNLDKLSSYQLWKPGLQLLSEILQIEEMHYPGIVFKVIVLKAPRIFPTIFGMVKHVVDPNTRKKIEIPSSSNALSRLLEFTTLENIPEVFGGKLKEAPEVCWGGRIPKELYKENDDSLQLQFVKPGKTFSIDVQVETVPQQLAWEFITDDHDIAFTLLFEGKELIPHQRFRAHLGNIEGSHVCEQVGTYVLLWDNSFSWTRGKNLRYNYTLAEYSSEVILDGA